MNGLILPGVTRHSILQLIKHWGIKVDESPITMKRVLELSSQNKVSFHSIIHQIRNTDSNVMILQLLEIFGSGTACVVSPIGYIEYMDQGITIPTLEQQEEAIYKRVRDTMAAIQYGQIEHQWAHRI